MRVDLNKLLCERERRGSRMSYRTVRRRTKRAPELDLEEGGHAGREGISRPYGWESKEFNENLNPLKGQVRHAVGRKWDAFYSDLCSVFDKRSVINAHILQHLYDFIETKVLVKADGKLYVRGKYGDVDKPLAEAYADFYVDPRTGIIRANKHKQSYRQRERQRTAEKAAAEAKVFRRLEDGQVLRKIDDTWFLFDVRPIPAEPVYDSLKREFLGRARYGENVYHTNRRTASRKLLRREGL